MPIKVESYQSEDGKFHATEIEAVRHEVLNALWLAVPMLRDRKMIVEEHIDKIAELLQPLAAIVPKNHPEESGKTTLSSTGCLAVQHSDQMLCAVCNLTWDTNDSARPACRVPQDHGELAGLCDCSAGMNGADSHHPSCPAWQPKRIAPSKKPRFAKCQG